MSKERGIIFQAWGVNAIRNLVKHSWPPKPIDPSKPIKWQTRRLSGLNEINKRPDDWRFAGWSSLKEGLAVFGDMAASEPLVTAVKCPYGVTGDGLWVRERAKIIDREFDARSGYTWFRSQGVGDGTWEWEVENGRLYDDRKQRWKQLKIATLPFYVPSIHMFREASREDLVLKEVRVERVQEISEEDAAAEGILFDGTYWLGGIHPVKGTLQCWPTARRAFQAIWDAINKDRGYGWELNPWLWVLSYTRI